MKELFLNFGDIISELKNKGLKFVFIEGINGLFLVDIKGNFYIINNYYFGSYLDNLIKKGIKVPFNIIDNKEKIYNIKQYKKEVWEIIEVRNFMQRQNLI